MGLPVLGVGTASIGYNTLAELMSELQPCIIDSDCGMPVRLKAAVEMAMESSAATDIVILFTSNRVSTVWTSLGRTR